MDGVVMLTPEEYRELIARAAGAEARQEINMYRRLYLEELGKTAILEAEIEKLEEGKTHE